MEITNVIWERKLEYLNWDWRRNDIKRDENRVHMFIENKDENKWFKTNLQFIHNGNFIVKNPWRNTVYSHYSGVEHYCETFYEPKWHKVKCDPQFWKVCIMPPHFYERPTSVLDFANQKNWRKIFILMKRAITILMCVFHHRKVA